jgi:hypothetical protein
VRLAVCWTTLDAKFHLRTGIHRCWQEAETSQHGAKNDFNPTKARPLSWPCRLTKGWRWRYPCAWLVVKLSLLDLEPASACTYCIHPYIPCRLLTMLADSPVVTTIITRDMYSEHPPHRAERYVQPATA